MTLEELLYELDGNPVNSFHKGSIRFRQARGWYYDVLVDGHPVRRGFVQEPLTIVDIEDLVGAVERARKRG